MKREKSSGNCALDKEESHFQIASADRQSNEEPKVRDAMH